MNQIKFKVSSMSETLPLHDEVLQFKDSLKQLLELKKQSESSDDPKAKQLLKEKFDENKLSGASLFLSLKRKNSVFLFYLTF